MEKPIHKYICVGCGKERQTNVPGKEFCRKCTKAEMPKRQMSLMDLGAGTISTKK